MILLFFLAFNLSAVSSQPWGESLVHKDSLGYGVGKTTLSDQNGNTENVSIKIGGITRASGLLDAFGGFRVSQPQTVFDFKRLYGTTNFYFQSVTFGAGAASTHDLAYASTTLTAGTVLGGYAISQTRTYWHYQPGKGIRARFTGNFYGALTGTAKRMGIFDDADGLFWEIDGTGLGVVQRSSASGSVVDTRVSSTQFSIDKLDGTGPSKVRLDLSKANIFFIEQEWLGVGDTFFGVIVDGIYVLAHQFNNSNRNLGVYTRTPQLPLRAEVRNIGTPVRAPILSTICWSLDSEGGYSPSGRNFHQSSSLASLSASAGVTVPVMAIKLKDAWKRAGIRPTKYWAVQSSPNVNAKLEMWLCQGGAGISNTLTWKSVDGIRTASEFSETAFTLTTATAGVICMDGEGISSQTRAGGAVSLQPFFWGGSDFDGNQDVFVLTYTPIGANGTLAAWGIGFNELY